MPSANLGCARGRSRRNRIPTRQRNWSDTRQSISRTKLKPEEPHGWSPWSACPRNVAFATIYKNQTWTLAILAVGVRLTGAFGWFFGLWFIRPLKEIIHVTQQLHQGHLDNHTHVQRRDELGDLAGQVNSVVDRFSEVISQIREMTASVSTASNELNSSAGQLAQGSHEQAATLQQIAGSLQSVDASVGRNAQHAKDTARMANEASTQAEKGETRSARRSVPCAKSPRRS